MTRRDNNGGGKHFLNNVRIVSIKGPTLEDVSMHDTGLNHLYRVLMLNNNIDTLHCLVRGRF